jgi:hypothetical protein
MYNCSVCGAYITPEHGGVVCKCGKFYCCDRECIDITYCDLPLSQSQEINYCPICKSKEHD